MIKKVAVILAAFSLAFLSSCSSEPRKPFGENCSKLSFSTLNSLEHIRNLETKESKSVVLRGLEDNKDFIQNLLDTETFTKKEAEVLSNMIIAHQAWIALISERYPSAVDAWQIKAMSSLRVLETEAATLCLDTLG